ncbi:MAG: GDSL-type esterase/lipase family protein [Porphyromonadaceae bacterium]|nr:GDSL-type esterase/lipase family protein [Porphyromonadaceae bacterium]
MKKIAIITARSGSKGLPNKNMLMAEGKPLLAYSIEAALEAGIFDKIILTTDSQEYIDTLSHYPIDFVKRAGHLATDKSSSFDVLEDVLMRPEYAGCDYFVLLQPTSPLRTATHITEACERFENHWERFDFLVSVSDAHKPTTLTRCIDEDESLKYFDLDYSRYARQNYAPEYSPNGALFMGKPQEYLQAKQFYGARCLAYFMDKSVSIDIDDRDDFEHFYFILQQRKRDQLLYAQVQREVKLKEAYYGKPKDITLLGGSLLALFPLEIWGGVEELHNLAVTAARLSQYRELVLEREDIALSGIIVLDLGRDDLRKEGRTPREIAQEAKVLVERIMKINPKAEIYLLECLNALFRVDYDNSKAQAFNEQMREEIKGLPRVHWVELNETFNNEYGKLSLAYTDDGLNLNQAGYELLANKLSALVIEK